MLWILSFMLSIRKHMKEFLEFFWKLASLPNLRAEVAATPHWNKAQNHSILCTCSLAMVIHQAKWVWTFSYFVLNDCGGKENHLGRWVTQFSFRDSAIWSLSWLFTDDSSHGTAATLTVGVSVWSRTTEEHQSFTCVHDWVGVVNCSLLVRHLLVCHTCSYTYDM